jgi:hypothetical protein
MCALAATDAGGANFLSSVINEVIAFFSLPIPLLLVPQGGLKLSIGSIKPVTLKTAYSSRWLPNVNKNLVLGGKKAKGRVAPIGIYLMRISHLQ